MAALHGLAVLFVLSAPMRLILNIFQARRLADTV